MVQSTLVSPLLLNLISLPFWDSSHDHFPEKRELPHLGSQHLRDFWFAQCSFHFALALLVLFWTLLTIQSLSCILKQLHCSSYELLESLLLLMVWTLLGPWIWRLHWTTLAVLRSRCAWEWGKLVVWVISWVSFIRFLTYQFDSTQSLISSSISFQWCRETANINIACTQNVLELEIIQVLSFIDIALSQCSPLSSYLACITFGLAKSSEAKLLWSLCRVEGFPVSSFYVH